MEIWIKIKGFEGYEISSHGRVKSLDYNRTGKEKIMKLCKNCDGYLLLGLYNNGKSKHFLIHRLVGQAFLGLDIYDSKKCVLHKDDNPSNNRKNNLFLGTHKDNMSDMTKKGRHWAQGKFGGNSNSSKKIYQYTKQNILIKNWESIIDIERQLGVAHQSISKCCKGKLKTAGGFIWKYANNKEEI